MKKTTIKEIANKLEQVKSKVRRHSALQITDNREIIADGCLKIVACDESIIEVILINNRLIINGTGLKMRNWGTDGVTISGVIRGIEFDEYKA